MDAMNAVKRKEAHEKGMKRIYKHGLTISNPSVVKRVMICGSPVIMEALQRKAAALKKTFSGFAIEAMSKYEKED
jgi:NAD(P)H-flavin reductase